MHLYTYDVYTYYLPPTAHYQLHTYDVFSDAQLLLTYGFVSARGEAALPSTVLLPLATFIAAARVVAVLAAGGGGSGRALPWAACEGWEAKVAACTRLLAPYGGTIGGAPPHVSNLGG